MRPRPISNGMNTKKITLFIGVILVLIGTFLWSVSKGSLGDKGSGKDTQPSFVSAETPSAKPETRTSGITYGHEAATSTPSKGQFAGNSPKLNRPIVIPASFPADSAKAALEEITVLIARLKTKPENGALWANLGMARKGIEDYEGAKEAYEHAHQLLPKDSTIADNLGVIYGDYLQNYTKAEEYYRLALSLDSQTPYRYLRLFDFYRYLLKDTAKAKAILEEGLVTIPGEASFTSLLETL